MVLSNSFFYWRILAFSSFSIWSFSLAACWYASFCDYSLAPNSAFSISHLLSLDSIASARSFWSALTSWISFWSFLIVSSANALYMEISFLMLPMKNSADSITAFKQKSRRFCFLLDVVDQILQISLWIAQCHASNLWKMDTDHSWVLFQFQCSFVSRT